MREISKRRSGWFLTSISYIDYDDVSQIIFHHIFKKWDQWNPEKPLEPWLNRIITNQIKNLVRNNYCNFARPCIGCPFNEGYDNEVNLCGFTSNGEQCDECSLYSKWLEKKRYAYNIKLPLSFDAHNHDVDHRYQNNVDLEKSSENLNAEMKKALNEKMYAAYSMLFIEDKTDEEVAAFMGYKTCEKRRKAGYKQIRNLKVKFKAMAKAIIEEKDIIYG